MDKLVVSGTSRFRERRRKASLTAGGHSSRPVALLFFSRSPLHTGGGGIRFARPVLNPTIGSSSFFFCFSSPHPPHLHLPLFFPGTVTEFQRRPSCRARELLRLPETRRTISPKQRPANGHETHASSPVFFSRSIFASRSLERTTLKEQRPELLILHQIDGCTKRFFNRSLRGASQSLTKFGILSSENLSSFSSDFLSRKIMALFIARLLQH